MFELPRHDQGEAFAGSLIDDRQDAELSRPGSGDLIADLKCLEYFRNDLLDSMGITELF